MDRNAQKADQIRKQAWDEAVYAYGTAYIFELRANWYRWLLRAITFLGIVMPVVIGAIYLSFRSQQLLLDVLVSIAGILGIVQLVLSIWSLIAKWEDNYSYALESLGANYRISGRFKKFAESPPLQFSDLQREFGLLEAENSFRSDLDNKQGINDKEKRRGMRAALRNFQRPCAACNQVPTSMKPSTCDVCGNF